MLYDPNNHDCWYQVTDIPQIQDTWRDETIADRFIDNLIENREVGIVFNLMGDLCARLSAMGVTFQVWMPRYQYVMGEYMQVANYGRITI